MGNSTSAGRMSPRTLLTTTISDELKLATNFQSKVIGIAIKDRGAILPAGHAANGAYWYDPKTGQFVTSSYYMDELPKWVNQFNKRKIVDSMYKLNWNPVLANDIYEKYCTEDDAPYEYVPFQSEKRKMPYSLSQYIGKDYYHIVHNYFSHQLPFTLIIPIK